MERLRSKIAATSSTGVLFVGLVAVLVAAIPTATASASCGTIITTDFELDHDLSSCTGDGLIVGADDITIELNGHTITGIGTNPDSAGVRIDGRSDVSIEGPGTVTRFRTGVLIRNSVDIEVEEVTAFENGLMAVSNPPFPLSPSDGFHVTMSTDVELEENVAEGNADDGINLHMSSGVEVSENRVDNNHHDGIRLDRADGNEIEENFVVGHDLVLGSGGVGCGIEAFGSKNNRIEENRLVANHNGIRLRADGNIASTGNTIEENRVSGMGAAAGGGLRGIDLVGASTSGNLVEENKMTHNAAGLALRSGPTGNTIVENRISKNGCGVQGPITGNTFEDNKIKDNGTDFC